MHLFLLLEQFADYFIIMAEVGAIFTGGLLWVAPPSGTKTPSSNKKYAHVDNM